MQRARYLHQLNFFPPSQKKVKSLFFVYSEKPFSVSERSTLLTYNIFNIFVLTLVYQQLHSILEKLISHPDDKIDIDKTR